MPIVLYHHPFSRAANGIWMLEEIGIPGGRQDQYAAAFGGMCIYHFGGPQVIVEPVLSDPTALLELESCLLLGYIGDRKLLTHHLVEDQVRRLKEGDTLRYHDETKAFVDQSVKLLRGLKIAVDCAHGATYHIAGHVFHELGADVSVLGNQPDGFNINRECGAVHPAALVKAVRDSAAHVGVAFDGDGDRLVMADSAGRLYDGDQLLYAIASFRHRRGELRGGVVGTLMTNLGLEQAFAMSGIPFARAAVGDRYVLEKMLESNWMLGGENSGHIICLDKHTTGDGIVSALQVLHAMRAENRPLAELTRDVTLYPQILINVRVTRGFDFRGNPAVTAQLKQTEDALRGKGRVLLRASGTEPVIRVMVEGQPKEAITALANSLADTIRSQAAS